MISLLQHWPAIAIYMPPSIKVSYAQNYDTDTSIAGDLGAMKQTLPADNVIEQIKAILGGTAGIATLRQGKKLVGEAVSLAGAGDLIRFLQKRTGTALNPRNEQFYDSTRF